MSRQVSRGDAPLSLAGDDRQPVWDAPVRIVHWILALLILFSWWTVHHHHTEWHIWSGCAILALLLFRLLWGFVGSSTARFATFVRGPRALAAYLRGEWYGIGHSPLGAISVLALLGAVAIQVALGLFAQDNDGIYMGPLARLVSSDQSDKARDLHATWFNFVLVLIAIHIAAILYYRIRGKSLTAAMITGKARVDSRAVPMRPSPWWVALACLALALAMAWWVKAGAPH